MLNRKLSVWQLSMELCTNVYNISANFPNQEMYGLISQIRRASVSICANIVEGHGRNSNRAFISFLNISRASAFEVSTLMEISRNLNYIKEEEMVKIQDDIEIISKMIFKLINKLTKE